MKELATNPGFAKDGNEGLANIEAELRSLENPSKRIGPPVRDTVDELKAENARIQREYQREWEWQMSGCQTTPPSDGLLPPEITERRFFRKE